jgi:Tol biopolymer transport system component
VGSQLTFVGSDRQIYAVDPETGDHHCITQAELDDALLPWGMREAVQRAYGWPTWSPDGQWLAVIRYPIDESPEGPFEICALSHDGVSSMELCTLRGTIPIYMQWSPDSKALAILVQQEIKLELLTVELDDLGRTRVQERGIPLFFTWTPESHRLLVHAGDHEAGVGRLVLIDPKGKSKRTVLPNAPGSFCAPFFVADRLVYAIHRSGTPLSELVVSSAPEEAPTTLYEGAGLLAIVPHPTEPCVVVSSAPEGEGTPYMGIDLVRLDGSTHVRLTDEPVFSMAWTPDGSQLLFTVMDREASCIRWVAIDIATLTSRDLISFWPSRETLFFLHFFDQYAQSHSIVSPCGKWLTFSGYPAGNGRMDLSQEPKLKLVNLQGEPRERVIGDAIFAIWHP